MLVNSSVFVDIYIYIYVIYYYILLYITYYYILLFIYFSYDISFYIFHISNVLYYYGDLYIFIHITYIMYNLS